MAIINKQFLDEDPEGLNFLVNLCYQSQRHQIETSVKGWKRASYTTPPKGVKGSNPKGVTGSHPKEEKEEEKEKGEVKEEKRVPHWNESIDVNGFQKK